MIQCGLSNAYVVVYTYAITNWGDLVDLHSIVW